MSESGPETEGVLPFPLVNSDEAPDSALIAVVRRLSRSDTIEEIMRVITQATRELLGADGITFVLREGNLCHYAEEQAIAPLWKGKRFPMSACISGWCMTNKRRVAIADIYQDARIPQDAYRSTFVRSLAMVPVRQDDPIAALGAYWATHKEASSEELKVLQALGDAAALAVANVQLKMALTAASHREAWTSSVRKWLPGRSTRKADEPEILSNTTTSWVATAGDRAVSVAGPLASWFPKLRQNSLAAFAFALACTGLAVFARWLIGELTGPNVVAFATLYPAILVTTFVAGWRAGAFGALVGGLWSWWAFLPPRYSLAVPDAEILTSILLYVVASGMIIAMAEGYRSALVRVASEEEKRQLLLAELRHRANNTCTVVQSIVNYTLKENRVQANELNRRIETLIATNNVLAGSEPRTTDLKTVLMAELNAYDASRVLLEGQSAIISGPLAKTLGLVFHELATNAAKYGALLVPDGLIVVSWRMADGNLKITWSERNGPVVQSPSRKGFGTTFLQGLLKPIGGAFQRTFAATGVVCEISLPYHVGESSNTPA